MDRTIPHALLTGFECMAAWADLLDHINVFPVADGDTGSNLHISLDPLGQATVASATICRELMNTATGNSGNIAVAFFSRALDHCPSDHWCAKLADGRDAAWRAVANPQPGTMLTVFDALVQATDGRHHAVSTADANEMIGHLDAAVRDTARTLPQLMRAGVVDAGALGMFIFFEGFLRRLAGDMGRIVPVTERFDGLLDVSETIDVDPSPGYCVNAMIQAPTSGSAGPSLADLGDSVVRVADGDRLRVHLHTPDHHATRSRIESIGAVVDWQVESMQPDHSVVPSPRPRDVVHVMTDAAGSLSRDEARQLGVTVLDSYIIINGRRTAESLLDPQALYHAMASGQRISTAQASTFQKHQSYQSVLGRFDQVIYLTVGSVYTGNYSTACQWRDASHVNQRFTVIDTGAASGRLGLMVRQVAGMARNQRNANTVAAFAEKIIEQCGELLFLDQLRFLAAGGRISKSKGFFGDLLGIKPIISPEAEGAVKAGAVRKQADQLPFAMAHLQQRFSADKRLHILIQFSDNEEHVQADLASAIQAQFPKAQISISRLSLTSGAHMGPGTWGLAYCPDINDTAV